MNQIYALVVVVVIVALSQGCTSTGRQVRVAKDNATVNYWEGYQKHIGIKPIAVPTSANQNFVTSYLRAHRAKNWSKQAFFVKQAETYWQELPDLNDPNAQMLPIGPHRFYRGILSNASNGTVRIEISWGTVGMSQTLAPREKQWALLPADTYRIDLYHVGESWPYRSKVWRVDDDEGNNTLEGYVCDFYIIAP